MKNNWIYTIITTLLFSVSLSLQAQTSKDYSVMITASVNESAPSITLNWELDNYAVNYYVYRKEAGTMGWGNSLASLDNKTSTWTDNSVEVGKAYEYYILETGNGSFKAYGYIQSGIAVEARDHEGTLLLIIESSLQSSMPDELSTLKSDLVLAGWHVIDKYVSSDDSVSKVKKLIMDVSKTEKLESIYLFGHIPVPYSGQFCHARYYPYPPDGHVAGSGDHCGAWAADAYYAVPEGTWTDNDSTIYGAKRDENKNYGNDGKFDQITLPGEVKYQLGRVDLWSLPAFGKSEVELLKQYVNKTHDFRHNISQVYQKGLIDENFSASIGAFASTAWRDFTSSVGPENIEVKDYFTTMKDSTYLLGYGAGAGSFTSCAGIGKTADFPAGKAAMFNYLFGSFFGDWDITNNFLRAPLASDTGGLVNAWVGRPWWNTFPLALGETIGYCARSTQNNTTEYSNYGLNAFRHFIHVALMGDPSLKLFNVTPATDLVLNPAIDRKSVKLQWTASADQDVIGYHIYYSSEENGPYGRLNSSLVTGTTFDHTWPKAGTNHYMVRAVKLQETASGTYFNLSQGIYGKADNMELGSVPNTNTLSTLIIYPNPAKNELFVNYKLHGNDDLHIRITDLSGKVLLEELHRNVHKGIIRISIESLTTGIYLVDVNGTYQKVFVQ